MLGMIGNETGGRVLMALDTGKLIRRLHAKVIPMTAEVIAWVNYLGRGEKSPLTFQNRHGEDIGERTVNRIGKMNRTSNQSSTICSRMATLVAALK